MQMCMWIFDGARNNFDRITAFPSHFRQPCCSVGYGVCIINFSYNFQWWIILKPCILVVDILGMWVLMEIELNLMELRPFKLSFFANFFALLGMEFV